MWSPAVRAGVCRWVAADYIAPQSPASGLSRLSALGGDRQESHIGCQSDRELDPRFLLAYPVASATIGRPPVSAMPTVFPVNVTLQSLLDRLRSASPDAPDWRRLHDIYEPLIRSWLRRDPGLRANLDDLAQDVFVVLVRKLPSFVRRRDGSFRTWLRTVAVNQARKFRRTRLPQPAGVGDETDEFLAQLADSNSTFAQQCDREHDAATSYPSCWPRSSTTSSRGHGERSSASSWTTGPRRMWPESWAFPRTPCISPSPASSSACAMRRPGSWTNPHFS